MAFRCFWTPSRVTSGVQPSLRTPGLRCVGCRCDHVEPLSAWGAIASAFLAYDGKAAFLLCHTSNPSAADVQNHGTPPLYQLVAQEGQRWGDAGRGGFRRRGDSGGCVAGRASPCAQSLDSGAGCGRPRRRSGRNALGRAGYRRNWHDRACIAQGPVRAGSSSRSSGAACGHQPAPSRWGSPSGSGGGTFPRSRMRPIRRVCAGFGSSLRRSTSTCDGLSHPDLFERVGNLCRGGCSAGVRHAGGCALCGASCGNSARAATQTSRWSIPEGSQGAWDGGKPSKGLSHRSRRRWP